MKQEALRKLPSIDEIINLPEIAQLAEEHNHDLVVKIAREVVDEIRSEIIKGEDKADLEQIVSPENVAKQIISRTEKKFRPSLRHSINAAGIVLHTGLGRALLPQAALRQINDAAKGYCNLAADIKTGQRGSRQIHFENILCELTGADAATAVNNNAAATMLVLNTLAAGKEVIISRGQLVEIGGAFRMPDVMESSGAVMREVGTTNKTHLRDYANAINENTGAIIRVHMSNYRIVGFFEEPGIEELAELAKEHNIALIDDLGSGALVDLENYGLEREPMIRESIAAGVDAACFSGDKLIGGPQSGIIVGKEKAINAMKKNPLARALRIGKLEVAALEATLKLFLDPNKLNENHPTYHMFSLTPEQLEPRAQAMAEILRKKLPKAGDFEVVDGESQVGSGSVPAQTMPSKLLSVKPSTISTDKLARSLRYYPTPIFARIQKDAVLFDLRTIQPDEDGIVVNALVEIFGD